MITDSGRVGGEVRPQFESAMRGLGRSDFERDGDGYLWPTMQSAWDGYRAALAAQGQGEPIAYFSADPAEGWFNKHKTLAEAVAGAESLLESAQDDASDYGWQDEPPQICYGVVLGECVEQEGSRRPAPEGSEFTTLVDYRLTHPAPAASPAGVPDGYVLVPREPNNAMLEAALMLQGEDAALARAPALLSALLKIYRAMVAAAPSAPERNGGAG